MKKFIYPFCILAMCAGVLSSCNKDEDEENIQKQKQLTAITYSNSRVISFEYDSNGRIAKTKSNNYIENYDYNNLIVNATMGDKTVTGKLNANGYIASDSSFIKNFYIENYYETDVYTYDQSGHLVSLFYEQFIDSENKNTNQLHWTWQNDDITSVVIDEGGLVNGFALEINSDLIKFGYTNEEYTTPIENKTGLFLHLYYNVSGYVTLSKVHGVVSKHLPVTVEYNDMKYNVHYTFDSDGYPTSITYQNSVIYYTWK